MLFPNPYIMNCVTVGFTIIAINTKHTNAQRHPPKYKITKEMGRMKMNR